MEGADTALMVAQRFGEEALRPYLAPLTPSQAKLVAIYVQRARVRNIPSADHRSLAAVTPVRCVLLQAEPKLNQVVIVWAQMKSAQTFAGHPDRENELPAGEAERRDFQS